MVDVRHSLFITGRVGARVRASSVTVGARRRKRPSAAGNGRTQNHKDDHAPLVSTTKAKTLRGCKKVASASALFNLLGEAKKRL